MTNDNTRVMKDASQGSFDYFLKQFQITNDRSYIPISNAWFPCRREPIASREPPSLFHYIIKFNRKDVLEHLYRIVFSRSADLYGVLSTIILEAIWLNNKEFQEIGWNLLEKKYQEDVNRISLHKSMVRDETIFVQILDKMDENKDTPFFQRLREDIIYYFENDQYLFSETWFYNKKAFGFILNNLKSIEFNHDSFQNRFRLYHIELIKNEGLRFASGLVLENILPKDIIKHIINEYIG